MDYPNELVEAVKSIADAINGEDTDFSVINCPNDLVKEVIAVANAINSGGESA